MGSVNSTDSKLEKALAADLPEDERYFGLENFGNTCYCNSVLQALYFCQPFRKAVLQYAHDRRQPHQQPHLYDPSPALPLPNSGTTAAASIPSNSTTGTAYPSSTLYPYGTDRPQSPSGIGNSKKSPTTGSASSYLSSSPNGPATNPHFSAQSPSSSTLRSAGKGGYISNASSSLPPQTASSSTPSSVAQSNSTTAPIPTPTDIERPLSEDDTMLTALADLFSTIASQKKRTGSVPPKAFVTKLRQENELFSTYMHQDAHEFLNFILNNIVECLNREAAARRRQHELYQKHVLQQQLQQQQRNQLQPNHQHTTTNHIYENNSVADPKLAIHESTTPTQTTQQPEHPSSPTRPSYSPPPTPGHESSNGQKLQNGTMDASNFTAPHTSPSSSTSSTSSATAGAVVGKTSTEATSRQEPLAFGGISTSSLIGSESETRTFVHDLFEGQLSNEVRCLCCETVTQRVESFFDLSVDVEQNSSLTACLRSFSSTELLQKQDKFFCDACCSLQEAERRMRVKRLPRILALHLKRFKYVEHLGKYKKLSYRVVFPLELRLCNTSDDAQDPDRLYSLFAVVVHVGSGPNQGHYVSLIKSHGQWLLFDDDCVEPKDESEIQSVYGITQESGQSTEAGYILFYEQT